MKKSLLLLAVSLLSIHSAVADWVIVQKATTDGQAQEIAIKIKGDKTRMDVADQVTIIANNATADITMLMHAQKMMMKMDAASIKAAMAMASGSLGGNAGEPAAKPEATGQKEKVGVYDCEIYTWKGQLGTGKFWVAKDFAGYKELNESQDKLMQAMGNPAAALTPKASDFPGMVIKSEVQMMGKTSVSELVSAKEEAVEDTVFTLPTGYQEMKMPAMPAK